MAAPSVLLSLSASLKIIQHSREFSDSVVTGQLFGIDSSDKVEISNSFPLTSPLQEDADADGYQVTALKLLRDTNFDYNLVGWYQSCKVGGFLDASFIDAIKSFQSEVPNSVAIIYDHALASTGVFGFRAYRLADNLSRLEELSIAISLSSAEEALTLGEDFSSQLDYINRTGSWKALLNLASNNLISSADEAIGEAGRSLHYLRLLARQNQYLETQRHRRKLENQARAANGEELLPSEDPSWISRTVTAPSNDPFQSIILQVESSIGTCENLIDAINTKADFTPIPL